MCQGSGRPAALAEGGARIQLEDHAPDLDVVSRLEAHRLERPDHSHRPEAVLDLAKGLDVLQLVAGA